MEDDTRPAGVVGQRGWADRPMVVDVVVASAVVAVELVNLQREVTVAGYDPPIPVAAVAAWLAAMGLVLVWRRRSPLLVVVVVSVAAAAYAVVDLPTLNLPVLVVVFTAGVMLEPVPVGTALALGVGVVNLLRGSLSQLPIDLVVFGAVWMLGVHLRVRQEHARDLQRRREAELWRARSRERTQVARDLHDIVSNGVGGIYLQAVGAAGLLEEDPARAGAALDSIQRSARSTLDELRALLEVLRLDPEDASPSAGRGATPSLADLDELVDRTRAAGATVLVDVDGDLSGLPAGVSTTGYRTVQEALGNAVRHGGDGPVVLEVSATDGLRIEVTNGLAADSGDDRPAGGWGLIGVRERVRALGGQLETRVADGRFQLVADLPPRAPRG